MDGCARAADERARDGARGPDRVADDEGGLLALRANAICLPATVQHESAAHGVVAGKPATSGSNASFTYVVTASAALRRVEIRVPVQCDGGRLAADESE